MFTAAVVVSLGRLLEECSSLWSRPAPLLNKRKKIFEIEKEKKRKAKKRWKKEHQREVAVVKQKAEWELQMVRAQLVDDFETDKREAMEVEASGSPDLALAEERLAAEEFERMNEYDLDVGID